MYVTYNVQLLFDFFFIKYELCAIKLKMEEAFRRT